MSPQHIAILTILFATMGMFLWGRWRHDMVALGSLLTCVAVGLIAPDDAFAGFANPAVITVACVLVLSHGLQTTGAVEILARRALPTGAGRTASLAALLGLGALLSGVMNNVGAMALLMPVAVRLSGRIGLTPGQVLMPLAFGTILGGMTTLIGTPPNLIVSGFRARSVGEPFGMFDFTPVGLAVAVAGVAFVALVGWRLTPARVTRNESDFDPGSYLTEIRVEDGGKLVGKTLREVETALTDAGAQITGLARHDVRLIAPHGHRRVQAGDILSVEADIGALSDALPSLGLALEESVSTDADAPRDEAVILRELVVRPGSSLVGRTASDIHLRSRYGLNMLAASRHGKGSRTRLRTLQIASGDLLLMQGAPEALADFAADTGCVPLAERDLRVPDRRKAAMATTIMGGAIALAAFGILPAAVSFAMGVLASMALRTVPPRDVYTAIDWPVVVLLAALIPVAGAMETTGAADLIARLLMDGVAQGNPVIALTVILVVTMFLSDMMNNAATAAVMCPIALGTATALGVNPDSFLMAVAVGASCAFLTPIGHQNNTLILGPGGFGFGDYWRLGLPLELLIIAISVPVLLLVWPLTP
ncbi:MAG: di/tricarboxylate transporter [Paracoccaceae bacterium]|jgi:di/tricarboxylate transporter